MPEVNEIIAMVREAYVENRMKPMRGTNLFHHPKRGLYGCAVGALALKAGRGLVKLPPVMPRIMAWGDDLWWDSFQCGFDGIEKDWVNREAFDVGQSVWNSVQDLI